MIDSTFDSTSDSTSLRAPRRRLGRAHICALSASLVLACGGGEGAADAGELRRDAATLDAGTRPMDASRPPDARSPSLPDAQTADAGSPDAAPIDGSTGDGSVPDAGSPDAGLPAALVPVDPPAAPSFPAVIGTLSVAVRTGDGFTAGTDDGVELCLSNARCFPLDTPDIDDRERGQLDVYHLVGVDMPRAEVDQVTLRPVSGSGGDRWTPTCLDLRFDGEPVHCEDAIDTHIGTGSSAGERASWSDAAGLHQACVSCDGATLTHGPLQGAHGETAARVWVRTDATRTVGLRMADLAAGQALDDAAPVVAWAQPRPEDDFAATLEVEGLSPGREYAFRVEVDGAEVAAPGAQGTLRTAPRADSPQPVRLGLGSCTRTENHDVLTPLLAEELDGFVFLGDTHYADSPHREAHRFWYRRLRAVPERAALVARVPTVASWDDHDFVGNNSDGTCAGRAEAREVFSEYWANPEMGSPDAPGVFFQHRVGAVELFALDCRSFRPNVGDLQRFCEDDPSPPTLNPTFGPLGEAQTAWAVEAIASSTATFKLVSCGSQWTLDGSRDSWAAFGDARDDFLDALDARGVGGVVLLSGDVHRSEVRLIERAGGAYAVPEITASPLANINSPCAFRDTEERHYCLAVGPSYVVLDLDPAGPDAAMTARVHDSAGTERYRETFRRDALGPLP